MERAWWKETVIYQIYPRSFKDSNGDGIGDIRGIIEKIPYIKSLGVGAVWLCPVYESPGDDNGYDISDYRGVMAEFGGMADMDELIAAFHNNGIRLIMDLVVNHTSDRHAWFIEAKKSRDNPYRDYYMWRDGAEGVPPNNWESHFGGSVWEWEPETGQYYLHIFSRKQPDLNWENPKVRGEVYSLMEFWLDKGVDGFRMDVINMISKDPSMPSIPCEPGEGLKRGGKYYQNGPRVHEYLREMNARVLAPRNAVTVGETKGVDTETALKYVGEGRGELSMVFQFEHDLIDMGPGGKWDIVPWGLRGFKGIMSKWQTALHGKGWNSVYLENHDMPRSVSRFGNDSLGCPAFHEASAKLLAVMIFTMEGTPFVYQGQEIGMTNARFMELDGYKDIQTVNMIKEYREKGYTDERLIEILRYRSRDNARTPMQWSAEANAGFTSGTPWIEVNPNCAEINVAAQENDSGSILECYRKLIALRKENPVLVYGSFEESEKESGELYAYFRRLDSAEAFVVLNFSEKQAIFEIPPDMSLKFCAAGEVNANNTTLQPYEARIYFKG